MKVTLTFILSFLWAFCFSQMSSISEMRSANPSTLQPNQQVYLSGYYKPNDGGGGMFIWVDTSTKADNKGTIIRPTSIPSSSPGRYERLYDRQVYVMWFGADRTGVNDAYPAVKAAYDAAKPMMNNSYITTLYGYGELIFSGGSYRMDSTLVITKSINIIGQGSGVFPDQEVRLRYKGNTRGISIIADTHNGGARGVNLINLYLRNYGISTDSLAHGIFTNTRIHVDNVSIDGFGGDGIHFRTNDSGNANNSVIMNSTCYYNARNGIFFSGNESNNIGVYSCNFQTNGMCGVLDNSFLGNQYFNVHTSSNGLRVASGYNKTWCVHDGKTYQSIKYPNHSNIEPGVDPNWKAYWIENDIFNTVDPAVWNADSTYWITGSYVVSGAAATAMFTACYSEGGQGANMMNQFSMCIGGAHGAKFASNDNIYINPSTSQLIFRSGAGIKLYDRDSTKSFSGIHNTGGLQTGSEKTGHDITTFKYYESDRTTKLYVGNSTGNQSFKIINKSYDPARLGLTTLPRTGMLVFPNDRGFYMTDANNGSIERNFLSSKTAPPSTGQHAAGDWCLYTGIDTTIIGWKCTVTGTPGTWVLIKSGN